jgi:hypothetical protein
VVRVVTNVFLRKLYDPSLKHLYKAIGEFQKQNRLNDPEATAGERFHLVNFQ